MGLLDLLTGFQRHPAAPHVLYRAISSGDGINLSFKCELCGETLDWRCFNPERAQWRIDTWAGVMHRHGVGR